MSGTLLELIAFAVVILICIGFHEFGHFVFAKLFGIAVDEFAIGFGPRLLSWGKGETTYSLRALPVGGFVRMAGMLGLPGERDAGARNFNRATIPRRLAVMLAGIAFNLILAFVLFTVADVLPTPSAVSAGGPAEKAGLQAGDSILSIDGSPVDRTSAQAVSDSVTHAVNAAQGHPLSVVYSGSDGSHHSATVTPQLGIANLTANNPSCDPSKLPQGDGFVTRINGAPVTAGDPATLLHSGVRVSGTSFGPESGLTSCPAFNFNDVVFPGVGENVRASWRLGVVLDYPGRHFGEALSDAGRTVALFIPNTIQDISTVVSTPDSGGVLGPNGLQGPVGIAQDAGQAAQQGVKAALLFIALISLNLGYLNLVPIPFLDGGKIIFVVLEAIRGKRLSPQREASIYAAGLAFIILLVMFITVANLRGH